MARFISYYFPPTSAGSLASPRSATASAKPPKSWLQSLGYFLLAGCSLALGQCQPTTSTEQSAASTTAPDSVKLETAVTRPLPKFDVESPILRQLALLPPAERNAAPATMRRYQLLTRRFWLAHYYADYLLKEAKEGPPNLDVFSYQLATTQGHWRVVLKGIDESQGMPPTMADHLSRMRQSAQLQQAALSDLQADIAAQRPLGLDTTNEAAQPQVAKLLAPLRRKPGPINVRIR